VLEQPGHELQLEHLRVGDLAARALEHADVARERVRVERLAENAQEIDLGADRVVGIAGRAGLPDVALDA
jgi:hypothetical protein